MDGIIGAFSVLAQSLLDMALVSCLNNYGCLATFRVINVFTMFNGLKAQLTRKKYLPTSASDPLAVLTSADGCLSMDFMTDNLYYARHFKIFNAIDDYNREILAIEINISLQRYAFFGAS